MSLARSTNGEATPCCPCGTPARRSTMRNNRLAVCSTWCTFGALYVSLASLARTMLLTYNLAP
eukprot:7093959-Lingulodinium_polyedra.AAC.1